MAGLRDKLYCVSDIRAITYDDAVAVTQSDTTDDPNGPFSSLEATTGAGLCKVTTLRGSVTTIYLPLGFNKTLAVRRVWSGGTAATGINGYKAPSVRGA